MVLQSCRLEILDISYNELQRLPIQLAQPSLVEFHAMKNQLRKIPDQFNDVFRQPGSKMTMFRVQGNPLDCNWSIGGLADWTSTPQGRSVVCGRNAGERCPACASPPELKGKAVDEIKVNIAAV